MQAKVELLTPPDEVHDITEYELNNDRAHSVCFQLVNLQLKMDFHIEMLLWVYFQDYKYQFNLWL